MEDVILTADIWDEITKSTQKSKVRCHVAVAYMGQGGAELLPLISGSNIVVDASEGAVQSGQTDPKELLKLFKKGVNIFSHRKLHAKVYVLGTRLFIGSSNVSRHSANKLTEAAFSTTNKILVKQAKDFIIGLCSYENALFEGEIHRLIGMYRPPKIEDGKRSEKIQKKNSEKPKLYVMQVEELHSYSKGYEMPLKEGLAESKKNMSNKNNLLDEIQVHSTTKLKKDDLVIQVTHKNDQQLVSPPGRIVCIKKWNKKALLFIDVPNYRRKNINLVQSKLGEEILNENRKLSFDYLSRVAKLWH